MTAFERLLNTGMHLDVFRWKNEKDSGIGVHFVRAEIKERGFLAGEFGKGQTIEEACEDYIKIISGKTLVFNAFTDYSKEVIFV